jgi:hypothetical protein
MQSIQQGIENKIIINSKGLYSYVLIQFYSNITCQSFYAVFQDLTPTLPFTTVNINEVGPDGVVNWLNGEVQLNPTGGWTLTIYTQASALNTDPYNAEYLTEIEAIVLPVEDCEQVYTPSNSCADGVVIINDQNGDLIETVTVPSGQTETTVVQQGIGTIVINFNDTPVDTATASPYDVYLVNTLGHPIGQEDGISIIIQG